MLETSYMILCSTMRKPPKDLCEEMQFSVLSVFFRTLAHSSQIRGKAGLVGNKPTADIYGGTAEEEITDAIRLAIQAQGQDFLFFLFLLFSAPSHSLSVSPFPVIIFLSLSSSTGCCTNASLQGMRLSIQSSHQGVLHFKSALQFTGFELPPCYPLPQRPPPPLCVDTQWTSRALSVCVCTRAQECMCACVCMHVCMRVCMRACEREFTHIKHDTAVHLCGAECLKHL